MKFTITTLSILFIIGGIYYIVGITQNFVKRKFHLELNDPNNIILTVTIMTIPTVIVVAVIMDIFL